MITEDITVVGMTCAHCVSAVTEEIENIPGVTAVEVDLTSGHVVVTSDEPIATQDLVDAVDEAGYELAGPPNPAGLRPSRS
ncbi:heavy metal transport/detoxification protein [Rhodococcoides trifolii]|uniref:Heavy metal transport/detoxification protein n=1 Tax=Rhodococcoides trifolii TaxID=908250 RepID=A0A917CNG6_9NOCA|nr:heavy-metal-associated domain-containing protein [Rhodococcus trifolii]GGF92109.1 heavy metal transport/detoxification protein [Rhodococcus trifolii]